MRLIKKGSTNISVELYIIDNSDGTPELGVLFNTAGIDLNYRRDDAVVTSITEATLAALTTAHTDGGFLEVANGRYRFDLPDAAFATGVSQITIGGTVTGMVVLPITIQLVDFDPDDVVRMGLTALPNVIVEGAGGLFTRGTGAGQINQSANGQIDVNAERLNNVAQSLLDLKDFADAGYDPAANKVQGVVLTDTVTDLTNLPSITANWITAAGIATSALNGKGDWNIGKTGYDLSTAGILAIWHQALTAIVTAGSVGKLLKDEITAVRMATLTDWINGGRLDLLLDAIPTTAMRGTDSAALATALATAQLDLDKLTGSDGATLATIQGNYAPSKAGDAMTLTTAGILAIWHQLNSAIVTADSMGKLLKDEITAVRMATLTDWINGERLDLLLDTIKTKTDNLPDGVKKNTALSNFSFFMVDSTDNVSAKTGLSVASQRSIDGGAFASTTNSAAEIASGFYKIDLSAADLNGDVISFRFTATGANDRVLTIITQS
ncbi:hypothetical protein IH992_15005 [Candidatus Poribacteria bacterium]|nr:hypothetical protein [Candidatus Poribacteria bacterium]